MEESGLEVVEIEDVEEFAERLRTGNPEPSLVALSATVNSQRLVAVDVYDTYALETDEA